MTVAFGRASLTPRAAQPKPSRSSARSEVAAGARNGANRGPASLFTTTVLSSTISPTERAAQAKPIVEALACSSSPPSPRPRGARVLGGQALAATGHAVGVGVAAHRLDQVAEGLNLGVAVIGNVPRRSRRYRRALKNGSNAEVTIRRRRGAGFFEMLGRPGHRLDDDDLHRLLGQRGVGGRPRGVVAEVEIVPVGEVQVDRIRLHHADPARLGERDEARDSARIDPRRGDEDERRLGAREDARGLVDARRIGEALAAHLPARRRGDGHRRRGCAASTSRGSVR